jgi:UDP-2-acetamido-2,6-beta-L-arabino-hexul-4-ose reductase
MNIGITGSDGFLGWHLRALLHGLDWHVVIPCDRISSDAGGSLDALVASADAIVHLAGINRGSDDEVEYGNIAITDDLIQALERSGRTPHVLFASSIQANCDNPYGRAKRACSERLQQWADRCGAKYTTVVLPNVFGEFGRPRYNSVIATFCDQLARGEEPEILIDAPLELIHVQDAASQFLSLVETGTTGVVRIQGHAPILVSEVLARLRMLSSSYQDGVFPSLAEPLDLQLFDTLRSFQYPDRISGAFSIHSDARGSLWEIAATKSAGRAFVSWTLPGATRGNHYHRYQVERFAVISGQGLVRLRKLFTSDICTFKLFGENPGYVDMPTFCTHSIENIGTEPLLTMFWSSNPHASGGDPDTYPEPVLAARERA